MGDQELICRVLYDVNLTQLSIIAALDDIAVLVKEIAFLPPEVVIALLRDLDTVARNSDRSIKSMHLLPYIKGLPN